MHGRNSRSAPRSRGAPCCSPLPRRCTGGLALAGRLPAPHARIAAVLAASLAGAGGVMVGGQRGLALLVVAHGALWLYEKHSLGDRLPAAYLALRRHMTFAICMLLALTMFVSDAAGLS